MNDEDYTIVYKSDYYNKKNKTKYPKVLVFDLDETLGDFSDLEMIWNALQLYNIKPNDEQLFKDLLDLYPEFFRNNIFQILQYVQIFYF